MVPPAIRRIGSIPPHMASTGNIPTGMSAIDWPLARAALREALAYRRWGRACLGYPRGARGTVTPIAAAFTKDGMPNFIATSKTASKPSEGLARRTDANVWDVKSVKPLKKS